MTNNQMKEALLDMMDQWDKAKAWARANHPEWSEEEVTQAVSNAFTKALWDLFR